MREPIGLLGGTFDPIHVGHVALGRAARDQLALAEVRFIPTASSWQKAAQKAGPNLEATPAAQRAHLVELAIRGEPRFALDMHEIERGGSSYTIDTLRSLRGSLGDDQPLVLILGGDQFENLPTWRRWTELIGLAHLAVARRNGAPPRLDATMQRFFDEHRADAAVLRRAAAGAVVTIDMPAVDASATEIRALLQQSAERGAGSPADSPDAAARERRLRSMLPGPVLDYIRALRLYT